MHPPQSPGERRPTSAPPLSEADATAAAAARRSMLATMELADRDLLTMGTLPSPQEYDAMMTGLRAHGSGLSGVEKTDVARYLEFGAYSDAVQVIRRAASHAPRDLALTRLGDGLMRAGMQLLESRLGSVHRCVAGGPALHTEPDVSRIVELAASRPTVLELVRKIGGDPLWALEHIIQLIRHHGLVLGSPREEATRTSGA